MGEEYAECAHGSDDRLSCFGCQFDVGIGPKTLAETFPKQRRVIYANSFIQGVRELTGNYRYPLKAVREGTGS